MEVDLYKHRIFFSCDLIANSNEINIFELPSKKNSFKEKCSVLVFTLKDLFSL